MTGDRTVLSDDFISNTTGPSFDSPRGIVLEANGSILIVNSSEGLIIRVDPMTGDRTILGERTPTVWDNFQDQRKVRYDFINGQFTPYFANPAPNAVNDSRVVASYQRNAGELFDVIIMNLEMADLADYLSGAKSMTMDVWSPAPGLTVQITLENRDLALPDNFPIGRHSVYLASTTATVEWETLTFSFDIQPDASVANDNVDRLVLLFEPNTNNGTQWYFDNLNGPELLNEPCADDPGDPNVLADFDCNQNLDFVFHHGPRFRRRPGSGVGGTGSGFYQRSTTEEFDVIVGRTNGDLMVPNTVTMDVIEQSGNPKEFRISLQQNADDGSEPTEVLAVSATTDGGSSYQTLTYDFSSAAGSSFNQVVILYDPGNFVGFEFNWDNLQMSDELVNNTIDVLDNVNNFIAYPNPAKDQTIFQYELTEAAQVSLSIQHANGQLIEQVWQQNHAPGQYQMPYATADLPAGLYFYTLSVDGKAATGKLLVQ